VNLNKEKRILILFLILIDFDIIILFEFMRFFFVIVCIEMNIDLFYKVHKYLLIVYNSKKKHFNSLLISKFTYFDY
jgi:hypothetical protein